MSRYGIDYYGVGYYGSDNPLKYDAAPFTAKPYKQGKILLNWADPTGDWSELIIVRNSYGFPIDAWDGTRILTVYNGADPVVYIDETGLTQGNFYYYSIFVFSTVQYSWVNAGNAYALSVKDHGNTDKLYSYLPEIYKISQPYSATSDWYNPDLYAFLENFGFELDYEQSLIENLINKYDVQRVSGALVPTMMNQFGQTYEPAIGLQQNRVLLRDAITLTKEKGSKDGLVAFIKDFTGWGIPVPINGTPNPSVNGITVGHNIMLDYNDSSFEEGIGHWVSTDGTADLDHLKVFNIKSLSVTSNVATLIIGPHNYDVSNKVVISGLSLPLFNSATPVTLTAVDQNTSISFSITTADFSSISGYNVSTGAYGLVTPYPAPWVESTAPELFPNKTNGVFSVYNLSTSAQTINTYCGDDAPITKGIPVTAGTQYTFSIYAAKGATARTVTAKIKWFNRFGVYLSTSSGTGVSDNTATFSGSYRPSVTASAPTGAYYACPGISIASVGGSASNEHHYFDAAQFEASSSATSFDEARQLHLILRANRINELLNPHFASPITPWNAANASTSVINTYEEPNVDLFTIASASISTNVATVTLTNPHSYQVGQTVVISGVTGTGASNYNGVRTITAVTLTTFTYSVTASNSTVTSGVVYRTGNSLKLTATGSSVSVASWDGSTTSQLMGIYYPNTSYTFSVYAQAGTAAENVTVKINWYDTSYSLISSSVGTSTEVSTTAWARPYVIGTAPATAAYASVELDWATTSGNILVLDEALFENNGQVLDYFDGSNGNGTVYDLFWEGGVPNAARSHYYKNRFSVQTRLFGATLNAELPMGSTAAVYIAQPQT
jgi:hypothetical protein